VHRGKMARLLTAVGQKRRTTGIAACCARATSGHAVPPPSSVKLASPHGQSLVRGSSPTTLSKSRLVHHSILANPTSVQGHKPRRRSGPGASLCPQYLQSRRNFVHRNERRQVPCGLVRRNKIHLFYHFVSDCEHARGNNNPKRLGGFDIDR
jgi:hypothetical protein